MLITYAMRTLISDSVLRILLASRGPRVVLINQGYLLFKAGPGSMQEITKTKSDETVPGEAGDKLHIYQFLRQFVISD